MLSFKKQKIICTVGPLYLWFPVPGFNPKQSVCCWLNLWMRNLRILSANCIHFTVPFVSGVWAAGPLVSMGTPRINDQGMWRAHSSLCCLELCLRKREFSAKSLFMVMP